MLCHSPRNEIPPTPPLGAQRNSPTESLRAYRLDDVIAALEHPANYPKGVTSLIAQRWAAFGAVLLEKSDPEDVRVWSLLNNNGALPTRRSNYFAWIADFVKTAWPDPTMKVPFAKAFMQVIGEANKEMTTSQRIEGDPTSQYATIADQLPPKGLVDHFVPRPGANTGANFRTVLKCLYPAALEQERDQERKQQPLQPLFSSCLYYKPGEDGTPDRVLANLPKPQPTQPQQ